MHRRFPAATRRAVLTAVTATLGLVVGCGSGPAPEAAPANGARTVQNLLLLDDATTACIQGQFDSSPSALAALNREAANKPTGGQVDDLKRALRSCVSIEAEAELYVTVAGSSVAPATLPRSDGDCVRRAVLALTPAEQDTLLVGALVPSVEGLGYGLLLTGKLIQPCGLERLMPSNNIDGSPSAGAGGGGTGGTAPPFTASATVVSR